MAPSRRERIHGHRRDVLAGGDRDRWWPLERDPYPLEASQPGVFVASDARHGSVKRVASAVGEAAIAVQLVHQYLATLTQSRDLREDSVASLGTQTE